MRGAHRERRSRRPGLAAGPKKTAEGVCVLSSEGNLAWLELKTVKSELGWPKSVSGSAVVWGR
ncbi:hypothetical protein [Nonomuraea roseola]|uniref:Uncharacterized protein n=1 Tax=Nonomuraea roseola TaxID=46179 RepID=A0ABV5QG83_9ACTN